MGRFAAFARRRPGEVLGYAGALDPLVVARVPARVVHQVHLGSALAPDFAHLQKRTTFHRGSVTSPLHERFPMTSDTAYLGLVSDFRVLHRAVVDFEFVADLDVHVRRQSATVFPVCLFFREMNTGSE